MLTPPPHGQLFVIFFGALLTLHYDYMYSETESPIPPLTAAALGMIIRKRPVPPDHRLQEAGPSGSSFAWGRPLRMTVCKRPVPTDHHLQGAGPSRSSFARGRLLRMTICKELVPRDHHLQEAGPFRSSFARGRPLILATTKSA